jgi:hypothetical protein
VENGRVWLPRASRGAKSYVDRSVGDPNLVLPRRGRYGVAGNFIGLQNWPATFVVCLCGPKTASEPQIATRVATRRVCDALIVPL